MVLDCDRRKPLIKPIGLLAFWCWSLSASPLLADSIDNAEAHFRDGRFGSAAEIGAASGSVHGFEIAARAVATYATYLATPDKELDAYKCAKTLAERALEIEPNNLPAILQLLIADGQIGRLMDPIDVLSAGTIERADQMLARLESANPSNPFVHALRGAWHTEIVHQAGSLVASTMFGASADEAIAAYERALAQLPDNPLLYTEYAKALMVLDPDAFRERSHEAVSIAVALDTEDALGSLVQSEAFWILSHADFENWDPAGSGPLSLHTFDTEQESRVIAVCH